MVGSILLLLLIHGLVVTGLAAWLRTIHVFADRSDVGLSVLIVLVSTGWALEAGWIKNLVVVIWIILLALSFWFAVHDNLSLGRAALVMPAKLVIAGVLVALGAMTLARIGRATDAAREGRIGKAGYEAGIAMLMGAMLTGLWAFTDRLMPSSRPAATP